MAEEKMMGMELAEEELENVTGGLNLGSLGSIDPSKLDQAAIEKMQQEVEKYQNKDEINFKLGQYNAMVDQTSEITKSLTDSIKSIAQKV